MKKIMHIAIVVFFSFGLAFVLTALASDEASEGVPPLTIKHLRSDIVKRQRDLHPDIKLLDKDGNSVAATGNPVSAMKTCGDCHDTEYIEKNNYHSSVGMDEQTEAGKTPGGRAWDTSPGMFGRWNPLTYRYLSGAGESRFDMGTADWIMTMGPRHVGGGPAVYSRFDWTPLEESAATNEVGPDTHILDPATGKAVEWDWKKSGTVELNCFICHIKTPNNTARIRAVQEGEFKWATTATLEGTGLVERKGNEWKWAAAAFDADGYVDASMIRISDPLSSNCRLCHGRACKCVDPVVFENSLDNWSTETTGEVYSPERISRTEMNIKDRAGLMNPWDVHAERLFECSYCHYSPNNPVYMIKEPTGTGPGHLSFDARKLSINDYLFRPDHNLAKGHTSQGTIQRRLTGIMRDCEDCHNPYSEHKFLPYKKLHFETLNCQTCHVPKVYAPARMMTDWTVINADGTPVVYHRGVEGRANDPESLITGYQPALLVHTEDQGGKRMGPHNLISSWFWVEGDPPRPVRLFDLKKAFLNGDDYHPDIIALLDEDSNGVVSADELKLDTGEKVAAIAKRLSEAGVENPRIKAEIQPFTLSHGVVSGSSAISDCRACHNQRSNVTNRIKLASYSPGGVMPEIVGDSEVLLFGKIVEDKDGGLSFKPDSDPNVLYIHGVNRARWLNITGAILLALLLFAIFIHSLLRIITSSRRGGGKS